MLKEWSLADVQMEIHVRPALVERSMTWNSTAGSSLCQAHVELVAPGTAGSYWKVACDLKPLYCHELWKVEEEEEDGTMDPSLERSLWVCDDL